MVDISILPSGVMKHGWLENPRTEWIITDFNGLCSIAMFDYQRVVMVNSYGWFWIIMLKYLLFFSQETV